MGGAGTEFPFSCGGFEIAVSKFIKTPDKNLIRVLSARIDSTSKA
jgi:hypothetical protein